MSGVIADGRMTFTDAAGCKSGAMRVVGFVSFPLDLVFDVVLLPLDVVGGAFGARRYPEPYKEPERDDAAAERPAR